MWRAPSPFQSSFVVFFQQVPWSCSMNIWWYFIINARSYIHEYDNISLDKPSPRIGIGWNYMNIQIRQNPWSLFGTLGNESGMQNIFAKHFCCSKQSFGKSRHKQLLPVTSATKSEDLESRMLTWAGNPSDYRFIDLKSYKITHNLRTT